MANKSKNSVAEAKAALEKIKTEAANEVGVSLANGYNGDLTAREAGSIGGQMVKKICPIRNTSYERENRIVDGHKITVRYTYVLTV